MGSPDMHSLKRETGRGTCLFEESDEEGALEMGTEDGMGALVAVQVLLVGFVIRPFSATYCEERL